MDCYNFIQHCKNYFLYPALITTTELFLPSHSLEKSLKLVIIIQVENKGQNFGAFYSDRVLYLLAEKFGWDPSLYG